MGIATVLASTGIYIGAGVGAVVLIVIIALLLKGGGDKPAEPEAKPEEKPAEPKSEDKPAEPEKPEAAEPASESKPEPEPEPEPEPQPEPEPEKAPEPKAEKPATLEVEALSPSGTGEAPMLAADDDGLKMATDELPRIGTAEMPRLEDDGPAQYRTPAAQELSAAIASGDCPKCKAPTFVGSEDPEEVGADGLSMFKLTGRCGACGHKAEIIDMRVG